MFGDDTPTPTPPALPASPPPAPQFASGAGRPQAKGKQYGGTLVTSPLAPAPAAATARKSLVTM